MSLGRLLANIRLSDARDTGADCTSLFRPSVARLFRLRRWPYWTITSYLQLPLLDGFCENDEWAAAFDLVAIESPIIPLKLLNYIDHNPQLPSNSSVKTSELGRSHGQHHRHQGQ
jgi:hypothetical protein